MALTHNGTRVDIAAANLPAGYTKPTVTTFDDQEASYASRSFTIAKSGVEAATAVGTFTALMVQLNTDISALVTADFNVSGLTVTSYAVLKAVSTNATLTGVLYTDGAVNYVLTVDVYVKTAAL